MLTAKTLGAHSMTSWPMGRVPRIALRRSFALHMATSTRFPREAMASASAPHTVVLPTPPLPVTKRKRRVARSSATLFGWRRERGGMSPGWVACVRAGEAIVMRSAEH